MSHLRLRTGLRATRALAAAVVIAGTTAPPLAAAPPSGAESPQPVGLEALGTYESGIFDESAAEIVSYYPAGQRAFTVNAAAGAIDVLDIADPSSPQKVGDIEVAGIAAEDGSTIPEGASANSLDVRADGLVVVAVQDPDKTQRGWLAVFDGTAEQPEALGAVRLGALPDMVTLTPRGDRALVANEGEPAEDYSVDPEGSVASVKLPKRLEAPRQRDVRLADFHDWEDRLPEGVRIFGGREDAGTGVPQRPVSENLEPEYIAVNDRGTRAYVTLQENNAIAVVNVHSAKVMDIIPMGTQDGMEVAKDASDRDGGIAIENWPVQSYYLPDAIDVVSVGATDYLLTANEGDARDWDAYSEEARAEDFGSEGIAPICDSVVEDMTNDDGSPMTVADLQDETAMGRLQLTTSAGLSADGSCYDQLFSFGGRGFSAIDARTGEMVFDSGSEFEQILAQELPEHFNSDHSETDFDSRSDAKGPEPEAITAGVIDGGTYAFIANERVGGIFTYDVSDPTSPVFVDYVNNRDFSVSVEDEIDDDPSALSRAGDLGPEGLRFVPAADSPTAQPLLIVGNEVSGTTTVFSIS